MIVQTDPRAPRVVLVGPPGAGKSTIGRKLAKELGVELFDTDAGIESDTGRTIPDIFANDGEPEFRKIEERVVRRAILNERGVVSLGGGAVLSDDTRALLRNRTVVYLEISVAEGLRRTGASTQRPLLNGADPGAKYRELMRKRRPLYREVASIRVRTDGRSPGRVVRMILAKLGVEPSTPEPVAPETGTVATPSGSSRSRARRRARARAAAARRTAEIPDTVETPTTPAESETGGQTRRRGRGRRRGRRTPTGTEPAPISRSADHGSPESESTGAATEPGRQMPRRPRRARRAAGAPAGADATSTTADATTRSARRGSNNAEDSAGSAPAQASPTAGTTGSSSDKPATGRARRARSRRARARDQEPSARTESEQTT